MSEAITLGIQCDRNPEHYPVFKVLSKEETVKLEQQSRVIRFAKGEMLFKQAMPASTIMYIRSGIVKISREGGQGVLNLNLLSSCNFLALMVMSMKKEFPYSAYALTEVEVIAYDLSAFSQLMLHNAAFSAGLFHVMAQDMAMMNERFYSLCSKQMHGRMADILMCIGSRIYKNTRFQMQLTRKDLGDLTGMAKESATRVLKDLERDGLIQISGKEVEILDQDGLKRLSRLG